MTYIMLIVTGLAIFLVVGQIAYRIKLKNNPSLDTALKDYIMRQKKEARKLCYHDQEINKHMLSTAEAIDINASRVGVYMLAVEKGLKSKSLTEGSKNQLRDYWKQYRILTLNKKNSSSTMQMIALEGNINEMLKQIDVDVSSIIEKNNAEIKDYYANLSKMRDKQQ